MEKSEKLLKLIISNLDKKSNKKESSCIELKKNNTSSKIIAENISGIANSCILEDIEKGYIVFGVKDGTLELVGVNFDPFNLKKDSSNSDLEMWLRQMILGVDFKFISFKSENDLNFLIIEVSKALGRLAIFDKEAYIRIGKNTTKLSRFPDIEKNYGQKLIRALFGDFQLKLNY